MPKKFSIYNHNEETSDLKYFLHFLYEDRQTEPKANPYTLRASSVANRMWKIFQRRTER